MAEQGLKIGDLVRRDNEDVWRIVSIPEDYDPFKDRARCVCARAPLGWLRPDGLRSRPWAKVGNEDLFVIADLVLLPPDALANEEPAEYIAADGVETSHVIWPGGISRVDDSEYLCQANGSAIHHATDYQRITLDQARGPVIAFDGKLLCAEAVECSADDSRVEMKLYETRAGALVAVTSSRSGEPDGPEDLLASVVEIGDDVQAAHFAVLDHFDWNKHAQAMVTQQLGWSLRLEIA